MTAFISYRRADQDQVEALKDALTAKGADVWRDQDSILPGHGWEDRINQAILDASYFVACFSVNTENEQAFRKTYMCKELLFAASVSHKHPEGWLIPVLLDECEMPPIEIRDGKTIRDYQWVSLAGNKWDDGISRLVEIIAQLKKMHAQNRLRDAARRVHEAYLALARAEARIEFEHHESLSDVIALRTPPQQNYETVRKEYEEGYRRFVQTFGEEFHPLGECWGEMEKDKENIREKHRLAAAQRREFATTIQWLIILLMTLAVIGSIAAQELIP